MNLKSIIRYIHLNLALKFNLPFYHLGKKVLASREEYLRIFNDAKKKDYPEVETFLSNFSDKIETIWLDELALHTQVVIKKNPINYQHGKILYSILMKYLSKGHDDLTILETGTARGFSSIIMSKALKDTKRKGKIYTIDIIPHDMKMIWNCIDDNERMKSRKELLNQWNIYMENINFLHGKSKKILKNLNLNRINFAFLDAEHKYKDLKIEFDYVSSRQKKGDIIFFDDYTPGLFDEVVEFVDEIENQHSYKINKIMSSSLRGYAYATKLTD